MSVTEPIVASASQVTGCAAQGRLLAFATIRPEDEGWHLLQERSRMFHLEDRSSNAMRKLAVDIHKFVSEQQIENVSFCRRSVWEVDDGNCDEARIEALLSVIPGLQTEIHEHDIISNWVVRERPAAPENVVHRQQSYAQRRAIEMAQFSFASPQFGEWI